MVSSFQEAAALAVAAMSPQVQTRPRRTRTYPMEWVPLAAAAVKARSTFTVRADHDFWWYGLSVFEVGGGERAHLFSLLVNSQPLFDRETFLYSMVPGDSSEKEGFALPFPFVIPAGTTAEGLLTNSDAAPHDVRLLFHGLSVFGA